ncbi:MAG: ABC transporter ATP-binding protein [Cellulosilyticaceae bacterium]
MGFILTDVTKIYEVGEIKTYALKNINLQIDEGEMIVILGASGSGKSTLLNVMSGLDFPTSGTIKFHQELISKYTSNQLTKFRREYIGFIFQQYNLLQNLTVRENIEIGAVLSKAALNIDEIMKAVGLEDKRHKYPYQLSGGEQQRVAIARSVAKNPKIMFCDEPTGALDEETGKQVLELLQDMNQRYNMTTVIITHNPSIAGLADRVVRMNSGEIQEIYKNEDKKKVREIKWA